MQCVECAQTLTPVFDKNTDYQFDNALWLGFHGGYGMFIESYDGMDERSAQKLPGASYEAVLCHDCAHTFCETYPWAKHLLQPYYSHTHTGEYLENNPNHDGVDNPQS